MESAEIAVVGSLNVDFITRTPRMPAGGETLTAHSFDTGFGGKGANQAVACARLAPSYPASVKVRMVGNVGDDTFGHDYLAALEKEGIDTSGVRKRDGHKTGIANIIVEDNSGENRIMLATNANHAFTAEESEGWDMIPSNADIVVFQLEIPIPVVLHNMRLARQRRKHIILNPAPAVRLPDSSYADIDTLILNESEAAILAGPEAAAGIHEDSNSPTYLQQYVSLAQLFLQRGVRDVVVITLGSKGAVFASVEDSGHQPASKVQVVDTTAAGDTFVGGYAVYVATKMKTHPQAYHEGIAFAAKVASKAVEKRGAMESIPRREDFDFDGLDPLL